MSKPVDSSANGDAGRFWDLYGSASAPRTRNRAEQSTGESDAAAQDPPPGEDPAPGRSALPGEADGHAAHACLDWCPICRGAEVLRAGGSPEIRGQLQSVQRDSLMMLRALIDSYLQRPAAA